jgi:TonB family protein
MGLILGIAGLLVLAVIVGAGTYAYRKYAGPTTEPIEVRPSPPPTPVKRRTPPPPAAVATGTLHVESQPAGATISVDGVEQGTTPADLTGLTLGAHEVKLDLKGYASLTQGVQLTAEAPGSELKLALSRTAAPTGSAEISSDPPGATVRVDGTPVGQTPFSDARLKPGSHRVELTREGFEPWSGAITVLAGKKARVDARLRAVVVAPPPTLAEEGVDSNRIYVNAPPEVDTPARKSAGTSAAYPGERAPRLKSGDSVSVRINFVVTETGEVTDLRVVESAGRVVDEAVMAAVRKWKYSPAVRKGTPVKVRVEFRQTFRAG